LHHNTKNAINGIFLIKQTMMTAKDKLWTRNFAFIGIANLIMAISFYFLLPTLPLYLKEKLGATSSQIGLVLAFYTIAALLIRPFIGYAIDAFGRKSIYLISFIVFSSLFLGYIFAVSISLMIMIRFMHGLTWGSLSTSGSTIAVDLIPPSRRGEGISIFGLSMTIAMAIGPLIALSILGKTDYLWVFIIASGISMVGLILALNIKFPNYKPHQNSKLFSVKRLIEKSSIPLSLNILIITTSYGGIISFSSLYGKEVGVENSGLFFLLLSIGIGVSRFFSGNIFDKVGPYRIVTIGSMLLILGFPILRVFPNPIGYHCSAIIIGLGFGIIMPTFQAMVNNLVPQDRRGAANSTYFTCFDLGIGLGMVYIGFISERIGLGNTFLICAIIEAIALGMFILYSFKRYNKALTLDSKR
jgi:predicted MFS family arabinose efflux permease